MRLTSRLRFLADQFRRMPSPEDANQALDVLYGSADYLRFYEDHLREGLYPSDLKLLARGHLAAGQHLLDVGCGTGREAQGFRQQGLRVTAVDSTPAMVERARELARGTDIVFSVAGLTRLNFPARRFDAAYLSSNIYAETPGRDRRVAALEQFCRLLRPGGRVIFSVSIKPAHSWKVRFLVDFPLSLLRLAWPERILEVGDRFFRSAPGVPPILVHIFGDADEVEQEIVDAGLVLIDHIGDDFVARTPGGDQRYRFRAEVQTAPVGADLLVADLRRGVSWRLNHTARALWSRLAEGATLTEAASGLARGLGTTPERLEADAAALAADLIRKRLVEPRPGSP